MTKVLLANRSGLAICQRDGEAWNVVDRVLQGQHVTSVIAREGVILAGTTRGVQRSDDEGKSWREVNAGLTTPHVRWMAYHPDVSDLEFAGTEPAEIYVSRDGGKTWHLASDGLDVPFPRTMPERMRQIGGELFTVLDDGRLLVASLDSLHWTFIDVDGVNAVMGE